MASATHRADRLMAQLKPVLASDPGVISAYLFGSFARGDAGPQSDVDIGVLTVEGIQPGLMNPLTHLKLTLEETLGRTVDLVHLNRAPADLLHRVLRDGHLLIDKDPNKRIAFEVQARNEYWDLLPILKEYRNARGD